MPSASSTNWRALRSTVFALTAALLAVLGHVVGGGELPDPAALLLTTAIIGGAVNGLTWRQRSWRGILAVMAACQLAYHLIFCVVAHHAPAMHLPQMLAFHAIAAVLASIVLARGDRAVFLLLAALARAVPRICPAPAIHAPARWVAVMARPGLRAALSPAVGPASRRGPPQWAGRAAGPG